MTIKYYFTLYVMIVSGSLTAQENPRFYKLSELLELAAANALELKESNSLLKESQLQISLLQENLKPRIMVNATLPNLSRSIESRPLPDGRDAFVNRSTMYNGLGVRMNYQLAGTGGTLYARSDIERLDILRTAQLDYSRNYFFTPISFGIDQPLFQFNEVKWQKERNDLINTELTAQQFFIREEVIQNALTKYTAAFLSQLELSLSEQKVTETDSLFVIKQRLFDIGKVSKVEMLRLELERERNKQGQEQAQLDWEKAKMELCDYLDLNVTLLEGLHPPPDFQNIDIDPAQALALALDNAYLTARAHRRLKEAETDIEMREKDRGILFDLNVSLGFNNSAGQFNEIFRNLEDRQHISLGITLPITDGARRALTREIAQEQLTREQISIRQEQIDLKRTVTIDVKSYDLLKKNIDLNQQAMEAAREIYQLTSRQYVLGNLNLTELNISRTERDQALLQYYRSILEAGLKYYEIRKNCLYDFRTNQSLVTRE